MRLPGRAFFNVWEAGARWGCSTSDIIEWASLSHVRLVASLPRVVSGGRAMSGVFELNPYDLLPYFPRLGTNLEKFQIHNVRQISENEDGEWHHIDADAPVMISTLDVLIRAGDARAFEEANNLSPTPKAGNYARHDWDGMWQFVVRRIYDRGLPETTQELAVECEEWFSRRDATKVPDLSSIRKKISGVMQELLADRA